MSSGVIESVRPALDVPILARRVWLAEASGRRALACALAAELNRLLLLASGWEPSEETTETEAGQPTLAGGFGAAVAG